MIWTLLWACTTAEPDPPVPVELEADAGPSRTVPVGVAVKLDGRGSTGATSYFWDAGDGTTYESSDPTHIYRTPGNRTAILQVTGSDGAIQTASTRVTVYPRPSDTPPATASTLWVGPDGRVWGVVAEADALFSADADGASVIPACLDGNQPRAVTVLPEISVLCDGPEPRLLHFPFGSNLVQSVPLPRGSRPRAMTWRDDAWFITLAGTHQVATATYPDNLSYSPAGTDPRALVLTDEGPITARFRSDPLRGTVQMGDHSIPLEYDPGPDSDTGNRGVPNLLTLAASPDGKTVFVGGALMNTVRGTFLEGQDLTHETTLRGFFSIVDLETGEEISRRQFDDQGVVGAMTVSPLGNLVYVAFPHTQTVIVVDAFTGEIAGSLLGAGQGIDGMALSADGDTLYVNATLDREIRAYDVRNLAILPPLLWSHRSIGEEPLSAEVLRGKQVFNDSRDTRIAKDGYLACAACHPDGDHDGQTWDFTGRGEGLRNTTSLLGRAGMGMGPVHWTGNFDEIQDFEHDIRGPFRGTGLLDDADWEATNTTLGAPKAGLSPDLDALAAYAATLDATPASPHPESPDGQALFEASGCGTCHPPPLYTDSALDVRHDIGSLSAGSGQRLGGPLDGLDTPTLLGAWDGFPWLHDGSALTLEESISAHDTAPTDPADIALLADFVRSL